VSIGARNMVRDTNFVKRRIQPFVFTTPISLDCKDFLVKQMFNKILELSEFLKHLRFVLEKIDPRKFSIIINESNTIFISSNRLTCRTPNIGENKF
jgi:hypothetical protein